MARQEQLLVTDQDNALVLDNRFDPRSTTPTSRRSPPSSATAWRAAATATAPAA